MSHEPYKQVPIPEGTHVEPCPVCYSLAEIWRYSEDPDSPTETAVMCSMGDAIGPQKNMEAGCLLMMPPKEFYCGTIRGSRALLERICTSCNRITSEKLRGWLPMIPVFVFGSNLAGRHGKGAAKFARMNRGAIYGQGEGMQGNAYAIPTKDGVLRSLPLGEIAIGVERFIAFAKQHPEMHFQITPVGCGLAGYQYSQIAPMFKDVPSNCALPREFLEVL